MPLDLYDWRDVAEKARIVSPYGEGPYRIAGTNFILQKRPLGHYFLRYLITGRQTWSPVPLNAHRFDDLRLAGEYIKFLDDIHHQPIKGETFIVQVAAIPDQAARPPQTVGYAPMVEQEMDIKRWLTTYSGITGGK